MRLIDADKLMALVKKNAPYIYHVLWPIVSMASVVIIEPGRHGEWLTDDLGHTRCSECHERLPYFHCYNDEPNSDFDEEWDEEIPETRYCPKCGAKMDGGEQDAD